MLASRPLNRRHYSKLFKPSHIRFTWKERLVIVSCSLAVTIVFLFAVSLSAVTGNG